MTPFQGSDACKCDGDDIQYWTDDDTLLYQKYGATVDYTLDYGDGRFYWNFCVRPMRRVADVFGRNAVKLCAIFNPKSQVLAASGPDV
ncbi:hypothetical protein W02_09090 [Nitrospira sp. KM1]|uniref:hypothetical protein n=1 Tax=Nitrospira sp. KM1 TaxID=1936990 RepID=UPI0013A712A8|nr:hypothetical protein [Nitrospira sp. KM1]BCA53769.1 hypothetical protein W02_09090 [Nitrospira sp. KM1]